MEAALAPGTHRDTVLLETPLTVSRLSDGTARAVEPDGRTHPCRLAYGHVWTTLSEDPRPLFDIPEEREKGRRLVPCGVVRVKCSPLRAVENFLDIAHFPFVHTDILGAEPHTEVAPYKVDVREEDDEIWATDVTFFQPRAAQSAGEGIVTDYAYRVPAPTVAILYKTCPEREDARDLIAIFVQPVDEETSDVWPWMALFDSRSTMAEMISFQQEIFLQDRSILENQMPRKLPLDPRKEIPTRSDLTSVAYRRWLKRRGATYGAEVTPS
jgi:phenylpropionate dioxygenase-like ring-hydroxylating dioxygenase large terminal subunit